MPIFTPELIARHAATVEAPAAPAAKPDHKLMHLSLGVLGAGQVADTVSTIQALKRSDTSEANGVYGAHPSAARLAGTKAAVMVPTALLLDHLADTHPKLASSLALGIGALGLALAAHNTQAGR